MTEKDKKDNDEKIRGHTEKFAKERSVYESFCQALKPILEKLLDAQGLSYQVVTARAKNLESFEKKVRSGEIHIKSFHDMKDLAGCRIIFYLESEANRFVDTVRSEFEVVHEENKVSTNSYNAYHMTVRLKSPRADLPEYAQFKELKCEIQLTTVLFHSWSELNHDLIYKDRDSLADFDPTGFEALKNELETIMKDHIKVATRKFEVVSQKAQRLREGKQVFDTSFLSRIPSLDSNNEIYENLRLLDQYVGEFSEDKTPEDVDIIELLKTIIAKSKRNKPQSLKSIFGTTPGKTSVDITIKSIEILDRKTLTYNHFERVFNALLDLHKERHPAIKKKTEETIQHLSRYDYHVIKQVGYHFQRELVQLLERFNAAQLKRNFVPIMNVLEGILSVELSGESFDPKTQALTIIQGGVTANDDLKTIRAKSITLLKKIYNQSTSSEQRKKIIYVFSRATVLPPVGDYSDELTATVIADAQSVLSFYDEVVTSSPEEGVLMEMEEDCAWLYKRFGEDKLPPLKSIIKKLSKNSDYQVYRTLCGYSGRLATDRTWQEEANLVEANIDKYIEEIDDNNSKLWLERISRIAEEYKPGGRALIHFNNFLGRLGERKPDFALELINEKEEALKLLLRPLLMGLLDSQNKQDGKDLISKWVDQGKYLTSSATALWDERIDLDLLEKILKAAIKASDTNALGGVLQSIVFGYERVDKLKARRLAMKAIKALKDTDSNYWMSSVWHMKTLQQFLSDLSVADIELILSSTLGIPRLNHEVIDILAAISQQHPEKVLSFLMQRVGIQSKRKLLNYDAIPYHLDELGGSLRSQAQVVIREVMPWYDNKNPLYHWEADRLLAAIFPSLDEPLSEMLNKIIEEGDKERVKQIVIGVIRNFTGSPYLLDVCKRVIIKFGKPLYSNVITALMQTGMVSGEYGLVEAYKKKKQEVAGWKDDSNASVKEFHRQYTKYLDSRIEDEQKRSDDDIEFRKAGL